MLHCQNRPAITPPPIRAPGEDQQLLRDAAGRLAREHLIPLLSVPAQPHSRARSARLAAALGLDALILPVTAGGAGVSQEALYAVIEQLAHGPLDSAALLTLSVPALLVLRAHDALHRLAAPDMRSYLDGTTSVSLTVPGAHACTLWRLQLHEHAAGFAMVRTSGASGDCRLVLATGDDWTRAVTHRHPVASVGALALERLQVSQAGLSRCEALAAPADDAPPVREWLTETGSYLCALLAGTMQQAVALALDHTTTRHAFRRPLAAQQLVAARLADMLVATHVSTLFLRSVSAAAGATRACLAPQVFRHVALEAVATTRELVQLCGAHGYVEGLPAAAWFQQVPPLANLLLLSADALCTRAAGAARAGSP